MEKKKQIVFLEPWPTIMAYKIAKLFQKKGYKTTSIRILENKGIPDSFFKEAFDKIITFNLNFHQISFRNILAISKLIVQKSKDVILAIREISKLQPYVIICRATPSWPCALTKILFKRYPVIYFPYDIRSIGWDDKKFAKKQGISGLEIKAERFCFEHADGIIHKGKENELEYIQEGMLGKNLKINSPIINFFPYCSKEFMHPINKNKLSKKNKEIHTVYAGSIGSAEIDPDNYITKCCQALTIAKIHVHVYVKSNTISSVDAVTSLSKGFETLLESKYFHIHNPLDPKEIIKEISKYDFGLHLSSAPIPKEHPERKGGLNTSNKISSYLEAGLPWICYEGGVFICQIMKKYDIGFSFNSLKDLKKIKSKLEKKNYQKLEKNVFKARQDFLMENNFERLEKFIQEVVAKKKLQ